MFDYSAACKYFFYVLRVVTIQDTALLHRVPCIWCGRIS